MTVIFLTSGTSWTVPDDWNNDNNSVEAIGAGHNGSASGGVDGGSGGGAYAKISNFAATPGGSINIQIGISNGTTGSGTAPTANTWFDGAATLVAAGGAANSAGTGGAGGSTANSVGTVKFAGGNGANGGAAAGGGGGAGGRNGAGNNGSTSTGGSGDAGSGGAGGASGSGVGGNGTEWDATHGSGGGGGGATAPNTAGGAGGNYGGGAGGTQGAAGAAAGKPGIIVITYDPVVPHQGAFNQGPGPRFDRRIARRVLAAQLAGPLLSPQEPFVFFEFGWFRPLDLPTRRISSHALQPQGFFPSDTFNPPVPVLSWHRPLLEPTRRISSHALQPIGFSNLDIYAIIPPPPIRAPHQDCVFPIPFIPAIPVDNMVDNINTVVRQFNSVVQCQGLGADQSSVVTMRQIIRALVLQGDWVALYWGQIVWRGIDDEARQQFNAGFTVAKNDAFYQLTKAFLGRTTEQMDALFALAVQQTP